jgi:hypothetical protein
MGGTGDAKDSPFLAAWSANGASVVFSHCQALVVGTVGKS